jgi:hypothetical protein
MRPSNNVNKQRNKVSEQITFIVSTKSFLTLKTKHRSLLYKTVNKGNIRKEKVPEGDTRAGWEMIRDLASSQKRTKAKQIVTSMARNADAGASHKI